MPGVYGQDFFEQTNVPDDSLTSEQSTRKQLFENLKTTANVRVVEIGDFPSIQSGGVVSISLQEVAEEVAFKAKYVESFSNGDFYWLGDLIPLDTCTEEGDTVPCDFGTMLLMRKDTRYTGSISLGDSLYYHIRDLGGGFSALILLDRDSFFTKPECSTPLSDTLTPPPDTSTTVEERSSPCPVKLLVLYTTQAAEEHPDILDIIDLTVFETRGILESSEVYPDQLDLILAGADEITDDIWTEFSGPILTNVYLAMNTTEIQGLRSQYDADIVVILTGDYIYDDALGAVAAFGDFVSGGDSAYVIVQAGAALGPFYTFAHEFAHLFGCRHERKPDNCASEGDNSGLPEAHGFVIEKKGFLFFGRRGHYNTIMAVCNRGPADPENYGAGIKGFGRILHYSNPDVKWTNKDTGKSGKNNNASVLRNAACRIANYDVSENPSFSFDFPRKACPDENVNGKIEMGEGVPLPWQCTWQHSYDGFTWSMPVVNNCSGYNAIMPAAVGDRLYIRVTAGNINGPMITKHTDVLADNTTINCMRQDVRPGEYYHLGSQGYVLFPNPTNGQLMLGYPPHLNENDPATVRVYSLHGRFIREQQFTPLITGGVEMVNIESLSSGVYILVVQTHADIFRNSFAILK